MQLERSKSKVSSTPSTSEGVENRGSTISYDPDALTLALIAGVLRELEDITRELNGTKNDRTCSE
jgi:hypothetical protein